MINAKPSETKYDEYTKVTIEIDLSNYTVYGSLLNRTAEVLLDVVKEFLNGNDIDHLNDKTGFTHCKIKYEKED